MTKSPDYRKHIQEAEAKLHALYAIREHASELENQTVSKGADYLVRKDEGLVRSLLYGLLNFDLTRTGVIQQYTFNERRKEEMRIESARMSWDERKERRNALLPVSTIIGISVQALLSEIATAETELKHLQERQRLQDKANAVSDRGEDYHVPVESLDRTINRVLNGQSVKGRKIG